MDVFLPVFLAINKQYIIYYTIKYHILQSNISYITDKYIIYFIPIHITSMPEIANKQKQYGIKPSTIYYFHTGHQYPSENKHKSTTQQKTQ